ncbi:MAG TPA: AsmA family protein [Anaeromyxobacter sp.]
MAASLPRKIAIGAGAVVAAVIVLLVALVLLVNSGVATKRVADLVLPGVSRTLGREVTLKGADLKLFPNPRVRLAGLAVAGRPGEPALAELESLDVEVGLWPLLRSLGKEIDVRAFALVRPTVNLVRARDGTWNYEGLGAQGAKAQPEPAPASPGGGPAVAVQSVRIEKAAVRVIDRTQGKDDQGLALSDLDLEATGVGPGLLFDARIAAALADSKQNLHAQLSVARLPAGVPQAPQDWPQVQGKVQLGALALDRLRSLFPADLGAIVRGGTVGLDLSLSTADPRAYKLDGAGDLRDVKLRGQAASGHFRFAASWSPAKPDAAKIDLLDLALRGPGVDLGGSASIETPPVRAWFVLTGPLLDLDAVMGLLPESPEQAKAAPPPKGELLPEATRREIQAATARGTIAIGKVKGGRLEATDVKARAVLTRGTMTLEQLDATVFGGKVSGAGTSVSLAQPKPAWKLAANLAGLDVAQATKAFAGEAPLLGKLDGTLDVSGAGTDWNEVKKIVTGLAALAVKDGTLTTAGLGDQVLGGVAKGLQAAGRGGTAEKVAGFGGKTTFKNLAGKFTVKDGFLAAQSPLKFGSDAGQLTLGGRIGLGGELDLEGGVAVPKALLAKAVSGVPLPDTLDVPLALGGTLGSPRVSVRAGDAVQGLLKGQVAQVKKAAQQQAEQAGKKALQGIFDRFKK